MKTSRVRRRLAPAVGGVMAALLLIAVSGCGGEKIESRRLDREVAIDGTTADWDGALRNLDERPVSIGVMNDDESLYLCIVTDDEALVRQVVMQGLTTAFVPEGTKEDDAFRIRFPVGRTMDVARATPVEIGAGRIGETFVYELRVPLRGDDLQPAAGRSRGGVEGGPLPYRASSDGSPKAPPKRYSASGFRVRGVWSRLRKISGESSSSAS